MKRALFVGLNDYPRIPLNGCVRDATLMRDMLQTHDDGSPNFDGRLLTKAPQITRSELKEAIINLFGQPTDVALLYFSGHGFLDKNLGGYLVTSDFTSNDEGVSMSDVLKLANESPAKEIVIILDCCHSGALGLSTTNSNNTHVQLREECSVLTASRAEEPATEVDGQGTFTALVLDALSGGAADTVGKVTIASTYAYVDEVLGAWQQRPLLKANVSRLNLLRQCSPQVACETLRKLPDYFPTADHIFALDPSFEPFPPDEFTHERNEENEQIFLYLQKYRAARLVEPVGAEHMYFAAINAKACRLTKLGQFYWRLAQDGRI